MSEEIKHSPTPWKYCPGHTNESTSKNAGAIESADGFYVAEICHDAIPDGQQDPAEANAAHIVKCVNLHDELVEALKSAIALCNKPEHLQDDDWYSDLAVCEATLTKATK